MCFIIVALLFIQKLMISEMGDYQIDMSEDRIVEISCSKKDTSIVIHNEDGWSAQIFKNDEVMGNMTSTVSPNLVDFGEETGRILVYFFSKNESKLFISSIVYSQIDEANGCKGQRVVSIGNHHQMIIAGSLSRLYSRRNRTYGEFLDLCYWIVTPNIQNHYIDFNINIEAESIHYFPSGSNHISLVESKTGYGSNLLGNSKSALFIMKSRNTSNSSFVQIISSSNSLWFYTKTQSASVKYSYNENPSIKGSYDSSLISFKTFTIDRMGDYSIDMSQHDILIVHCIIQSTSVALLNKEGWIAYDIDYDPFNGIPVFDFGTHSGKIVFMKSKIDANTILLSSIVYSRFKDVECNQKVVSLGGYHKYIIANVTDNHYRFSNVTMANNQKICYWVVTSMELNHSIRYFMEKTRDNLFYFQNQNGTDSTLNYEKKFNSDIEKKEIFSRVGSIFFYWETSRSVLKGHVVIDSKPSDDSDHEIEYLSDNTYLYNNYELSISIYRNSQSRSTNYLVTRSEDVVINTQNLNTVTIGVPFPDTSIIIHEKTGW